MQVLSLASCPSITGSGLKYLAILPRLRYLFLPGSPVTDDAIEHLQRMKSLRILDINATKITAEGAAKLQAAIPDCVVFHESLEDVPWGSVPQTTHIWSANQPAPDIAPFNAEEAKQHQEEWAKHLGTEVESINSIGMKSWMIPPGEFLMGSSEEEIVNSMEEAERTSNTWGIKRVLTEGPQHRVTLSTPFGMSIHEVTRGQFRQFVDATGYQTDAEKDGAGGRGWKDGEWVQAPEFLWNTDLGFDTQQTDDHPVINVSWNDAVAFCEWLTEKAGVTYRLPTEAQWEFSCRAGSLARFSFGDEESLLERYAWYRNKGGRNTKPVGQKQPNAFGLLDLHGNVWEWCHDRHGPYKAASVVDPLGSDTALFRSLRGGSFSLHSSNVRTAYRNDNQPTARFLSYGFRPSRTYHLSP